MQDIVIEGTAQEIMAHLAQLPAGERVRLVIARPSVAIIARRVQAPPASGGMSENIRSDFMDSLKEDGQPK